MTTPEPLDLEAIESRVNEASKGPWTCEPDKVGGYMRIESLRRVVGPEFFDSDGNDYCEVCEDIRHIGNAEFIAHARQDIPALIAEIRSLRDSETYLKGQVNAGLSHIDVLQARVPTPSLPAPLAPMRFNLNNTIRVKLTDLGYQALADRHNEYVGRIPGWKTRTADFSKQDADKDGYTKFQGWEFMQIFGPKTSLGGHMYYDTEILIQAADLHPNPIPPPKEQSPEVQK